MSKLTLNYHQNKFISPRTGATSSRLEIICPHNNLFPTNLLTLLFQPANKAPAEHLRWVPLRCSRGKLLQNPDPFTPVRATETYRFYSSMGNPTAVKGLKVVLVTLDPGLPLIRIRITRLISTTRPSLKSFFPVYLVWVVAYLYCKNNCLHSGNILAPQVHEYNAR